LDEGLPLVDTLLPNEDELIRIAQVSSFEEVLAKVGPIVRLVVVKCGSIGALVYERGVISEIFPLTVTAVDTIGASDTFKYRLSRGVSAGQALRHLCRSWKRHRSLVDATRRWDRSLS